MCFQNFSHNRLQSPVFYEWRILPGTVFSSHLTCRCECSERIGMFVGRRREGIFSDPKQSRFYGGFRMMDAAPCSSWATFWGEILTFRFVCQSLLLRVTFICVMNPLFKCKGASICYVNTGGEGGHAKRDKVRDVAGIL